MFPFTSSVCDVLRHHLLPRQRPVHRRRHRPHIYVPVPVRRPRVVLPQNRLRRLAPRQPQRPALLIPCRQPIPIQRPRLRRPAPVSLTATVAPRVNVNVFVIVPVLPSAPIPPGTAAPHYTPSWHNSTPAPRPAAPSLPSSPRFRYTRTCAPSRSPPPSLSATRSPRHMPSHRTATPAIPTLWYANV